MWPSTFEERLVEWNHLRSRAKSEILSDRLLMINDWWWRAPMVRSTLSWQQRDQWPDAWDLLNASGWCDLARALGMLYTVMIIDQDDVHDVHLVESCQGNLVLVNQGLYILNWSPRQLLNIQSSQLEIKRSVSSKEFQKNIG